MECPNCLLALQRVVHREYTEDCDDCGIRRHAYMPWEELHVQLELVAFVLGPAARCRAWEKIKAEKQRIHALALRQEGA